MLLLKTTKNKIFGAVLRRSSFYISTLIYKFILHLKSYFVIIKPL